MPRLIAIRFIQNHPGCEAVQDGELAVWLNRPKQIKIGGGLVGKAD